MLDNAGWRRTMRASATLTSLSVCLMGVGACDDDDPVEPIPVGAVATFANDNFNFNSLATFSMPDTVLQFRPRSGIATPISRLNDQVALDRVRANLLARGYTEVTNPQETRPDFVVLVGATAAEEYDAWVGYAWYSDWAFYSWGWYAPGFTSDWGIVYPWYPVVGVTSYRRGTLVVDLIPTLSVNPLNRTVTSAWAGVGSGVVTELSSGQVEAVIDEMFRLSPYLRAPGFGTRFGR